MLHIKSWVRNKRASLNEINMVLKYCHLNIIFPKVMNQILLKWWQFPQWNILLQTNQIWKYHFVMRKSVLDIFSSIVQMDQLLVSKILWMILTYNRLGKISNLIFLPQETHLPSFFWENSWTWELSQSVVYHVWTSWNWISLKKQKWNEL